MDGLEGGGGTKRLSTLIHHKGWKAQQIEAFVREPSRPCLVAQWQARGEEGFLSLRWHGVGKTGNSISGGIVPSPLKQSRALDPGQKGLLSSPGLAHLCARTAWHRLEAFWPL